MMMKKFNAMMTSAALLIVTLASAAGGEATFTAKPQASKAGGAVKITFTVSAPVDVEVAVLDAGGKIVRHLGAGLLGENPPEPFKKGLAQEITWDGKDDLGKPAAGGGARVRVRLGLAGKFDRIIGWNGNLLDQPRGLACGPDGTLYVVHGAALYGHRRTTHIAAFDRDGKYSHQVFPPPGGLPPEKREGWPHVRPDGVEEEVPIVWHMLSRCAVPGAVFNTRNFPIVTSDGRLIMVSGAAGGSGKVSEPDMQGGRRILTLNVDGSVPENYLGPEIVPQATGGFGHVALTLDEKTAYVTGFFDDKGFHNVIYKLPLDGGKVSVFAGRMHATGSGKEGLNAPAGLDVDADGNVYVADYGNNRVAVFSAQGTFLDEFKVECPDTVRVSRKTGAVYVMALAPREWDTKTNRWYVTSRNWSSREVVKFGGLKDTARKASLDAKSLKSGAGAYLALDDSGDTPILWVAGTRSNSNAILKVADQGNALKQLGEPINDNLGKGQFCGFIGDVGAAGGKVFARHPAFGAAKQKPALIFDAESGEFAGSVDVLTANGKRMTYGETLVGKDGRLYSISPKGELCRMEPDGKPAPFAATGKFSMVLGPTPGQGEGHVRNGGLFVARDGTVYAPWVPSSRATEDLRIKVIAPSGEVKNEKLVHLNFSKLGGIVADSRGNVYVDVQVSEKGRMIPDWFAGKLPEDTAHGYPRQNYKQYAAIIKFPPTGGGTFPGGEYYGRCRFKVSDVSIKGHVWFRRGGYVTNKGPDGVHCYCETTRLDIDAFDRLFVPDVHRFSVRVMDTAGNELTHFGGYGNMDNRGPESAHPDPAIPFGWPLSVRCDDGRAFIADLNNRRVVAVKCEYAESAECAIQ